MLFSSRTKNTSVSKTNQEKFSITDRQAITLAGWGMDIEKHYIQLNGY